MSTRASIRNANPGMNYRRMGKTGIDVSAIGFGMMRLPLMEDKHTVDEKATAEMLRYAIDHGVNYVDTAYNYMNNKSEEITGRILRDGYREKVHIATKCPWWLFKEPGDFDRYLDEQLERLQTNVIDFYMLHGINELAWRKFVLKHDMVGGMRKAREKGKIRFIGFSIHERLPVFKEILDHVPDWDFCQVQYNYLDDDFQAGVAGLKYAAEKDIAIAIMEPLRGGFLADVPKEVGAIFDTALKKRSPVEWAFDYVWNRPEPGVVLSGMTHMPQVVQNVEYAGRSSIGMLLRDELDMYGKIKQRFSQYDVVPCTGCAYCLPCPKGVTIPYNFLFYNQMQCRGERSEAQVSYDQWLPFFGNKASKCVSCGQCVSKCPQKIEIPEKLGLVKKAFEG